MTEYTPIPENLSQALSPGARRVLERARVRSCEDLLALGEGDALRVVGCGQQTLGKLRTLQRLVLLEYPGLLPHYTAPLPAPRRQPESPAAKRTKKAKPAGAPPPPCRPAGWSMLNRTWPDLFQLPPLPPDGDPASESSIATLELPAADLKRLRAMAVFPEDPIGLLGSLSLGYLSQAGLGDSALSIIHKALAGLHGLPGAALPALIPEQVRDTSLYAGIAPDLLEALVVVDFPCALLLEEGPGCRPPAVPWGTLARITERTVIERLGFSSAALSAIGQLWLFQHRAASVQSSARAGLPFQAYGDFYRLADAYLDLALGTVTAGEYREFHRRILRARLRLAEGGKCSLRQLGKSEGVSGERVRQVEHKLMKVLRSPEFLQHLGYLWQLLDHLLVSGGGVRYLSELAGALAEILGWPSTPGEALAAIVDLSPNYRVNWQAPIRVVRDGSRCVRCASVVVDLAEAVAAQPELTISFEAAMERVRLSCRNSRCPEMGKIAGFSRSILHCVADAAPGVMVRDEQLVARPSHWQGARRHLLEQILLEAGKAMHYTEVRLAHNKAQPASPLAPRQVYSTLMEFQSTVLWGAGTFIHRDLVSLPRPLIAEIQ